MTIRELVHAHLSSHEMSESDQAAFLPIFEERDKGFDWEAIAPRLSKDQADRLDRAANGWLMAHGASCLPQPLAIGKPKRDGKLLATGERL